MKILMVRMTDRVSGSEVYNLNLLQGFTSYPDVRISFLTNSKYFLERIKEKKGHAFHFNLNLEEIGTKKNYLKAFLLSPILIYIYLKKIQKLERNGKFDLICLQSMTEKIFLTPLLKLLNYKVIWIEHGPLFKTSRAKIIKLFYVLVSILVNKIITVSQDTEVDLIKGGVNKKKIKTIYIGVDTEFFKPFDREFINGKKKELGIRLNDLIIGFLGSVCEEKGIKEFIEIAKKIIDKNINFKFLVIGDGSLLQWSRDKVKKEKIDKYFIFSGHIEDVKNYISILNILFFPTKHQEGISLSLLEAMAMGKVVVARDMGGNNEIINKNNGYLYSGNNKDELVSMIIDLLNNKEKLKIIGNNARDKIMHDFNIKNNINNFYDLFLNI